MKSFLRMYYFVYILSNVKRNNLYIGITNDILRREKEHKEHFNRGFTDKYFLHKVVYYEVYETPREAIIREKRLKKWKRAWKIRLIEEVNPKWEDYLYITKLK